MGPKPLPGVIASLGPTGMCHGSAARGRYPSFDLLVVRAAAPPAAAPPAAALPGAVLTTGAGAGSLTSPERHAKAPRHNSTSRPARPGRTGASARSAAIAEA